MGHRANLVVVDRDGWRLYYSHWVANGIYRRLAAGPAAACAFVLAQRQLDPGDGWLDDVWSEGGALIDSVQQHLVWYGNDRMAELSTWRAYHRLLAETWPGWRIRWAYDGIGDLADHVGVDPAVVRSLDMDELTRAPVVADDLDEVLLPDLQPAPTNEQGSYELLTVRTDAGLRSWVLDHGHDGHLAWLGPGLLDQLPGAGFDRLRLGALPLAGLHLDVPARQVGIWTAGICPGLLPTVDTLWPGWQVTFWADRYEHQLAAAPGVVSVPPCDEAEALQRLAEALRPESWDSPGPLAWFAEMVERDRAAGHTVEVNPAAWRHTETRPDQDDLSRLAVALADVGARLRAEKPG